MYKLTDKECEELVKMVASGRNTYKELRTAFPNLRDWNLMGRKGRDVYKELIKLDKKFVDDEFWEYQPVDTDTFHLTKLGEDLLYKIQKHNHTISLSEVSNALTKDSNEIATKANDLAQKAIDESRRTKYISFAALIVSILSFLYSFFY